MRGRDDETKKKERRHKLLNNGLQPAHDEPNNKTCSVRHVLFIFLSLSLLETKIHGNGAEWGKRKKKVCVGTAGILYEGGSNLEPKAKTKEKQ